MALNISVLKTHFTNYIVFVISSVRLFKDIQSIAKEFKLKNLFSYNINNMMQWYVKIKHQNF